MFRPQTDDVISKEYYQKYEEPHFDLLNTYLVKYVIPDFCAFYIFSAFHHHSEEEDFIIFIESALVFFNVDLTKKEKNILYKNVIDILKLKYGLLVINNKPLKLKDIFPKLS